MINEKETLIQELTIQEALNNLQDQPGWTVLVDHINKIKTIILDKLLNETDHLKIITLQERHRAFNSVIETVLLSKNIKDHIQQQLTDIIEEEEFKKQIEI